MADELQQNLKHLEELVNGEKTYDRDTILSLFGTWKEKPNNSIELDQYVICNRHNRVERRSDLTEVPGVSLYMAMGALRKAGVLLTSADCTDYKPQQQEATSQQKQQLTTPTPGFITAPIGEKTASQLSADDQGIAEKIRQIEEETRGTGDRKVERERILALLKPRFRGKDPAAVIKVCSIPNNDTGNDWHTYYFYETEAATEAPGSLPDAKAIPPHTAELLRGGESEPCLKHTIEMSIGVTGPWVSQKKIVPYEVLPAKAKNQQELERLVTAATEDYVLVGKEIRLPFYMREGRRKIAAVVFKNSELYKSEEDRKQVAQLLQKIDDAITLRSEGKISEEEVMRLVARLREKPTAAAPQVAALEQAAQQAAQQQPQLEGTVSEAYVQGMYAIPARLKHGDMINAFLRRFEQPYEVALDVEAGLSLFRFTKPGLDEPEAVEKARDKILWLETFIGMIRGIGTKEGREQKINELLPTIYQRFGNPEQK
ncbi:hypothetical protein HYY73_03710 [Candidatus Woesearchaeota archaeon]|nr:hypothetical protein [Candidatus Woesearchaeota archaeon]